MKPFVCPVCGGNGLVNQGFYTQTSTWSPLRPGSRGSGQWGTAKMAQEKCRTCSGAGVVWGVTTDLRPFKSEEGER